MSCDSGRAQCFAAIEGTGNLPAGALEAMYQQAIDFETFAAQHGAAAWGFSEPALHRRAGASDGVWKRLVKQRLENARQWQEKRDKLLTIYEERKKEGKLREPTEIEKLVRRAEGHDDNESVLAARRVLAKRFARNPKLAEKYPAIAARYAKKGS
jgi:hypothetical protein